MARNMQITFLGTSSGGGPSPSRNCSSLVANVIGDGTLWMVDCAEGTTRQFLTQPRGNGEETLRAHKVSKLFVTHMHGENNPDHVMGIVPFLRHILFPPAIVNGSEAHPPVKPPPRIEIYGPAGLRTFVRSILSMTLTKTADTYAVHELLTPQCPRTPCDAKSLHSSECPGLDILCDEQGFWQALVVVRGRRGNTIVDAGPIFHRDPCIGYIIREPHFPNRKIAILGDTYDASGIEPLLKSPPPSLLIHEATDTCIPTSVDPKARRKDEEVRQKVLARGHSTPVMAGEFAKRVGAERLVLNHIGIRFTAPRQSKNRHDVRFAMIEEISRQASEAWGMGHAQVAFDFMRVDIPAPSIPAVEVVVAVAEDNLNEQVNASDAAGRSVGQRGSGEGRQQRGRGRRGWRNYSGRNEQSRNDGKGRMGNQT
ncbi:beta-lactamase-like protein [Boletus edulis BED1]|uniref:Beta-lactamase-like protein n=1 Tax=Boletus edulis BED1 TaxID=1328754 RepID=A0AAD4C4F4_BOLED|nr:beta-lactamase-like protein [Boletus edulis BED1]